MLNKTSVSITDTLVLFLKRLLLHFTYFEP